MIDFIVSFFTGIYNNIIDFIDDIIQFINQGLYGFVVKAFAEFVKWYILGMIKFKITLLEFSWDTAKVILQDFNISGLITNAFNAVDLRVMQFVTFFRIPEAINILMTAAATKIILRLVGF